MLKNSPTKGGLAPDEAMAVGIRALEYLASQPALLQRFLDITGIAIGDLRPAASHPSFFAGLLDFFLEHEPTLEAFAAESAIPAEIIVAARGVLAPSFGDRPH